MRATTDSESETAVSVIRRELDGLRSDLGTELRGIARDEVERRFNGGNDTGSYYTPESFHRSDRVTDPLWIDGANIGGTGGVSLRSAILLAAGGDPRSRELGATAEFLDEVRTRADKLGLRTKAVSGATDAGGGYLIPHQLLDLQAALTAESVAVRAGARILPNLVGDVTAPIEDGLATAHWFDAASLENITESSPTVRAVNLTPHYVGALVQIGYDMLKQTAAPTADVSIRSQLARQVSLAVDKGVLDGTGANGQPLGMLRTNGIGQVDWTGATYDSSTIATDAQTLVRRMIQTLRDANAIRPSSKLAFIGESDAIRALESARDADGRPLFIDLKSGPNNGSMGPSPYGIPSYSTTQIASADTTDLSLLLADMRQVMIGSWGGVELAVSNDHSGAFANGSIWLRAIVTADVGVIEAPAIVEATDMDEADIPA